MSAVSDEITHVMSFDVEALGQTPRSSGMVELAVVVWRVGADEPADTKYFFFGTDAERCPRTWLEFWDNKEQTKSDETPWQRLNKRLARENPQKWSLVDAALELTVWAHQWYKRTDGKIIVITDTPGFDYQFISDMLACVKQLPAAITDENEKAQLPFSLNYLFGKYQPVCDINSFYKGVGGVLCKSGARDRMIERLAVDKPQWLVDVEEGYDHNPLNDAKAIAGRAAFYLSLGAEETPAKKKAKTAK